MKYKQKRILKGQGQDRSSRSRDLRSSQAWAEIPARNFTPYRLSTRKKASARARHTQKVITSLVGFVWCVIEEEQLIRTGPSARRQQFLASRLS